MTDKIGRNDKCWCGSGQKYKKCHAHIDDMMTSYSAKGYTTPTRALLKTRVYGGRYTTSTSMGCSW